MNKIPVCFTYLNKPYCGHLIKISGGGNLYHLYIKDYYQGQLVYSEHYGWQFTTQRRSINLQLSEHFGKVVKAATPIQYKQMSILTDSLLLDLELLTGFLKRDCHLYNRSGRTDDII